MAPIIALSAFCIALAVAVCASRPFVPYRLTLRPKGSSCKAAYRVDGGVEPLTLLLDDRALTVRFRIPDSSAPLESPIHLRVAGSNPSAGPGRLRVRVDGRNAGTIGVPPGRFSRKRDLAATPNSGGARDVRIEVDFPGLSLERLELANTVASHHGPAGASLFKGNWGPSLGAKLSQPKPWLWGAAFAALLLSYWAVLSRLAAAGRVPAGSVPAAWIPVPAASLCLLSALPHFVTPYSLAVRPAPLMLWIALPTAAAIGWDLLRKRAAAVGASRDPEALDRFRTRRAAFFLFLSSLAVYNANGTSLDQRDVIPLPYTSLSLAREADFDLEEFDYPGIRSETHAIEFVDSPMIDTGRHWISKYPPGGAILSAPLLWLADQAGILVPENKRKMLFYGKLSASIYVAISVAAVFLSMVRLGGILGGSRAVSGALGGSPMDRKTAIFLSLVYAFGTSAWSTASQSGWQHGFVVCFLALAVWRVLAGLDRPGARLALGAFLALMVLSRPASLVPAAGFLAFLLHRDRRSLPMVLAGAAPFAVFQIAYNLYYFGGPFSTGYGPELSRWKTPLWEGAAGLLVSPNRGLLVFSPALVFALLGIAFVWRHPLSMGATGRSPLQPVDATLCLRYLSLGCLAQLLLYAKWSAWDGGWCYGCRLLTDILPLLALFLAIGAIRFAEAGARRRLFLAAAALSIAIHALGVFFHNDRWNNDPASRPWSFTRTQIGSYLRNAWQ